MHNEYIGRLHHDHDRREIVDRIIGQIFMRARDDRIGNARCEQRITVRRCLGDEFAAERAVHEPVPRNRVFPFELLGDGLDAEVRLGVRGSGGVSGVARVEVGLVGDGEGDGGEGGLELAVL